MRLDAKRLEKLLEDMDNAGDVSTRSEWTIFSLQLGGLTREEIVEEWKAAVKKHIPRLSTDNGCIVDGRYRLETTKLKNGKLGLETFVDFLRFPASDFTDPKMARAHARVFQQHYAATDWKWDSGASAHIPDAEEILKMIKESLGDQGFSGGISARNRPNGWVAFSALYAGLWELRQTQPLTPIEF